MEEVEHVEELEKVDVEKVDAATIADDHKKRKKIKKVRSVWISFVGRILAQFVGSAATIVLGLLLLHKYQPAKSETVNASSDRKAASLVATKAHKHESENSIAVLPVRYLSREGTDQYIADSMTDVLKVTLAQIPGLVVVGGVPASSLTDESRHADAATSLGVRYLLEGSLVQADGRIRLTARLVDTDRDMHVWGGNYERPVRDILKMEDEIANSVVREVTAVVLPSEGAVPAACGAGRDCVELPVLSSRRLR